jgi:LysR family glycine cleavage system transcriptional activator
MARHLPSLSALRAFEATARHLSFTRAAVELNLTQTAVSHRIKELEGLLSVQLFNRRQNGITLTDVGRSYLDAVRPAMVRIAVASDQVSLQPENRLTVSCLSAFATKRLLPALPAFRATHPDVGLRLLPANPNEPPGRQDFDVAIWHGLGDWPGFDVQRILPETIFPVCAPALWDAGATHEVDLAHQTVVRTVSPIIVDEWSAWLEYAGRGPAAFRNEVYCESLYLTMTAVQEGIGFGIGRTSLIGRDLAAGRLVEPFDIRMPSASAYHLVGRPERSELPRVRAFRRWLLAYFAEEADAAS